MKAQHTVDTIRRFIQRNANHVSEMKGAVSITLPENRYVFKIRDISHILDMKDGFNVFILRPRSSGKSEEFFSFNKKDIQEIYIDFDTETHYGDERPAEKPVTKGIEMMYL